MGSRILFLVCLVTCVWEARGMSLKGPMLTRYDPCGLGMLHFDRMADNYWRGIVHFGLYPNMIVAELVMVFKEEVTLFSQHDTCNFTATRTSRRNFIVHTTRPIPEQYIFYVSLDYVKANKSDVPHVDIVTLNNVTLCNDQIKAAQTITSLNVTQSYAGKPYVHLCGRRAIEHAELVSVRTEARAGDWPWHVAIIVEDENNVLKYKCGGNVVSKTAIITAGHCVFEKGAKIEANRVLIIAGVNNHKDINQPGRQVFLAQDIILHPAYDDDLATADLAIIRVDTIQYTEYVQPICIWGPVYEKTSLFGKEATVVGFGATENNKQSDVLRSTYIMVQNDTNCINFAPKVYAGLLNEFTFCAGYGPTSSINPRNGDSGGGLVVSTIQADHMISWFLRGILSKCGVSPGHTLCDPKYYVVYTDVAPHYGWIYHHSGLEFRSNVMFS